MRFWRKREYPPPPAGEHDWKSMRPRILALSGQELMRCTKCHSYFIVGVGYPPPSECPGKPLHPWEV